MIRRLASRTDGFAQRVLRNTAALVSSEVLRRIGVFVAYVLVARLYGEDRFGEISLGLAFQQSARTLAAPGLQLLLIREVSRHRDQASSYLLHGSLMVVAIGLLMQVASVLLAMLLDYPEPVLLAIWIMSFGVVPFVLGVVAESVLQGLEKAQYITWASGVSNVFSLVGIAAIALLDAPFTVILWVLVLTSVLSLAVEWWALYRLPGIGRTPFKWSTVKELFDQSLPFAGIRGLQAILGSFVIILVSKLVSETAAGIFNAAVQLMNPISLLMVNTLSGTLPVLSDKGEGDFVAQGSRRILRVLFMLVVPGAVGLLIVAEPALRMIYGEGRLLEAAPILQLTCWVLILRAVTQVFGQLLIVTGRERTTVRILVIDFLLVVLVAPILVWSLGLVGAAVSVLVLRVADAVQHFLAVRPSFTLKSMLQPFWAPAAASIVMAVALSTVGSWHVLAQVAFGGAAYAACLAAILWMTGGLPLARRPRTAA